MISGSEPPAAWVVYSGHVVAPGVFSAVTLMVGWRSVKSSSNWVLAFHEGRVPGVGDAEFHLLGWFGDGDRGPRPLGAKRFIPKGLLIADHGRCMATTGGRRILTGQPQGGAEGR